MCDGIEKLMNSTPKVKFSISILTILFLMNWTQIIAQDFLVKKDLRLDWVYYDQDEKVMLPFLDNNIEYPVAIHLSIDSEYGNEAYLMLEIPAGTSLFLENKFVGQFEGNETNYFLLDSLGRIFKQSPLQLTLYNKKSFKNPSIASIGFRRNSFDATTRVNPINERDRDSRSEYLKIIILVLFSFFVMLQSLFPSDLKEFISFRNLITFRYTNTLVSKYRSLTKTQILVIVYQAALLSGLLIVFLNYYNNPFEQTYLLNINPLKGWVSFFGMVLLLFIFKYVLISILSFLFDVSDRINFYFIEFLRMSMIFYSILFLVISYTIINKFYLLENLLDSLIMLVVLFNLLRFFILYFKFRGTVPMKNLHLFSYLCTTELIPIILGVKFFVK